MIDGTPLAPQMKGVGRYLANVLREIALVDAVHEFLVLVRKGTYLPDLPHGVEWKYFPITLRNHIWHGFWELSRQARNLRPDVVWIPYEATLGLISCPTLITVHDVSQDLFQAEKAGGERITLWRQGVVRTDWFFQRASLRRARTVFSNSHFVGTWLRNQVGIPPDQIVYAPCAPGADFSALTAKVDRAGIGPEMGCPDGYILVFATGDARENIDSILAVYDLLVLDGAKPDLMVAGLNISDNPIIENKLRAYGWQSRVHLLPFYGEDRIQKLAEIYAGATLYLDLSLHEGFGMQVVEAMASGTPVICSNRGALPEVVGDGALLVNPSAVDECARAVRKLLSSPYLAADLRAKGKFVASRYSWKSTARVIMERFDA